MNGGLNKQKNNNIPTHSDKIEKQTNYYIARTAPTSSIKIAKTRGKLLGLFKIHDSYEHDDSDQLVKEPNPELMASWERKWCHNTYLVIDFYIILLSNLSYAGYNKTLRVNSINDHRSS